MKELTCIGCPLGCSLTVETEGGEIRVTGNTCPRGETYAKNEILAPKRTVTSTIAVTGGSLPRVSVKTAGDIPKEKIFEVMRQIRSARTGAPVRIGDILIRDCAGTGVGVIATKNVE